MFNSCNTPLPNLDCFGSALSRVVILTPHFRILLQKARGSRVSQIAETEPIQVVTCCGFNLVIFCVNLDRTKYHAVDAGFWVVLKLIIRWIRFLIQSDRFIIFGDVCSFSMDPDSAVQLYSVMLSRAKRVYKLCFKQRVLLAFHI
jgi:hypothetical protein